MEVDFLGFVIRICFNVKSQRTKTIEVFSQGTDDSIKLSKNVSFIKFSYFVKSYGHLSEFLAFLLNHVTTGGTFENL